MHGLITTTRSQSPQVVSSDTIFVSFAGHGYKYGEVPRAEFKQFLATQFPHVDALFLVDAHMRCYHQGIQGETTNVPETVEYIREKIKPYKKAIFLGVSAGGYAAILFGSLLQVHTVLAFIPQTSLKASVFDDTYRHLDPYIHPATHYILVGDAGIQDPNSMHHISHCDRIAHHANVDILRLPRVDMKQLRNDGTLKEIVHAALGEGELGVLRSIIGVAAETGD